MLFGPECHLPAPANASARPPSLSRLSRRTQRFARDMQTLPQKCCSKKLETIRDQSALCRLLLQYDEDPNARDAQGFSPLMWTAPDARTPSGQVEFARELLTWNAAVDATLITRDFNSAVVVVSLLRGTVSKEPLGCAGVPTVLFDAACTRC